MEFLLSCAVLSFPLLVALLLGGAFLDFLATLSSTQSVSHGNAFAPGPRPTHIMECQPDRVAQYDRAA
jgi:hypothetical protein